MFRDDLLAGQHILVTGGATGLGKAMAERFLALGANICICGRRKQVCEQTADSWRAPFPARRISTFGVDIRDAAAVEAMVEAIWTTAPLTGLVNNAAGNFVAQTQDLSSRAFDAIANVVFHGTFYVTNAVGRRWIAEAKAGHWTAGDPLRCVTNIITTWVRNGSPFVVPSAMSKAGVDVMTKSLAVEWARYGIRLNSIGPGEIPTEGMSKRLNPGEQSGETSVLSKRVPAGRVGDMIELQNLATFLMTPGMCDYLTGEAIMMDGANALATGGSFYSLTDWTDQMWKTARQNITSQNARDRSTR
jgi:NAD(P)-dependent dehydrogenase (short-subunit alcohol dehydrogenase family)